MHAMLTEDREERAAVAAEREVARVAAPAPAAPPVPPVAPPSANGEMRVDPRQQRTPPSANGGDRPPRKTFREMLFGANGRARAGRCGVAAEWTRPGVGWA